MPNDTKSDRGQRIGEGVFWPDPLSVVPLCLVELGVVKYNPSEVAVSGKFSSLNGVFLDMQGRLVTASIEWFSTGSRLDDPKYGGL